VTKRSKLSQSVRKIHWNKCTPNILNAIVYTVDSKRWKTHLKPWWIGSRICQGVEDHGQRRLRAITGVWNRDPVVGSGGQSRAWSWKPFVHFHRKVGPKVKDVSDSVRGRLLLAAITNPDFRSMGDDRPVRSCLDPSTAQKPHLAQDVHKPNSLCTSDNSDYDNSVYLWMILVGLPPGETSASAAAVSCICFNLVCRSSMRMSLSWTRCSRRWIFACRICTSTVVIIISMHTLSK